MSGMCEDPASSVPCIKQRIQISALLDNVKSLHMNHFANQTRGYWE